MNTNCTRPSGRVTAERYAKYCTHFPTLGLTLDISRMPFGEPFLTEIKPRVRMALDEMQALEGGYIANADERRMVGHYWLRNPDLAPTAEIRQAIERNHVEIKRFAASIHSGEIQGAGGKFKNVLLIGIGGSALGPQFVSHALGHPDTDRMHMFFFDNTDPDGMDRVLASIGRSLGQTLCIVISKSGGTKETANGMMEAKAAYERIGLRFERHAVAITMDNSQLHAQALNGQWLIVFPMWDWVGGRTSQLSAVGLLPCALQGINIDQLIAGAKACDEVTRRVAIGENAAAQLALMWFVSGNGKGLKDMVIVPYSDRLELLSRYLQQLVMESIGKRLDRDGKEVHQGISVFGNKGATDQHSYIQQLRDGINNFYLTFIEVNRNRVGPSFCVDESTSSGDYLHSFLMGTRNAISEMNRDVISITIDEVSAFSIGVLIALYERSVGLYASLVNINAYHQPGVEAGKRGAAGALQLRSTVIRWLRSKRGQFVSAMEIVEAVGASSCYSDICSICETAAANPTTGIRKTATIQGIVKYMST